MADILSSSKIGHTGVDVTNSSNLGSAANSDSFTNDGSTLLVVKNGSGSGVTVTISATESGPFDDSSVDETATVAAGETGVIGPFGPARFNNSSGQVDVSYSSTTSIESKAFQLADPLSGA